MSMFSRRVPFGRGFCEFGFGLVEHYRERERRRRLRGERGSVVLKNLGCFPVPLENVVKRKAKGRFHIFGCMLFGI